MIVKYYDERTELSLADLEENIYQLVRPVKFGPGDIYNTGHKDFTEPWMGEYSYETNEFKFFKTKLGSHYTSEFYIRGKFLKKPDHTIVQYSLNTHYMILLGFLGLNMAVAIALYFAAKKGWFDSYLLTILGFIAANMVYFSSILKDFRSTDTAFKEFLTNRISEEYEE